MCVDGLLLFVCIIDPGERTINSNRQDASAVHELVQCVLPFRFVSPPFAGPSD